MNILEAEKLMKEKLIEHGLTDYRFEWSRAKRILGDCNHYIKVIRLSKPLTEINGLEEVLSTILHEIAHALTPGHHHDSVWQKKCLEIGGDGKRCSTDAKVLAKPFKLICTRCNEVICTRIRKRDYSRNYHKDCGRPTDYWGEFVSNTLKWGEV